MYLWTVVLDQYVIWLKLSFYKSSSMLNNKQEYLDKNIFIHDLLYYIVQIFCCGIICLHNADFIMAIAQVSNAAHGPLFLYWKNRKISLWALVWYLITIWNFFFLIWLKKIITFRSQYVVAMGVQYIKQRYKMGIQNDIGNCYTKVSKVAHGHDVKRLILKWNFTSTRIL